MMVSFTITRFARAASPSPSTRERGMEKGQGQRLGLDKRVSALFTLLPAGAQPQNSASPTPADEQEQNEKTSAETETETENAAMNPESKATRVKMDRRFSTLFSLSAPPSRPSASPTPADEQNEETSAETDTTIAMSLETQSTRVKMERRFSTLFSLSAPNSRPSTPPSHDETSCSISSKSTLSRQKSLKLLFRRIFSNKTSSTRDETKSIDFTSEEIGSRLWADLMGGGAPDPSTGTTLAPPASSTKQRSQTTVVVLPSSKSRPKSGVEIVGILRSSGGGNGWGCKRADSKFSSITSLPSLRSLSLPELPTSCCEGDGGMVNISSSGLVFLESCVRRIGRGLAKQEYLASHLSKNLIHLFTKKETQLQILIQRRLRPDEQNSLLASLARIRELTGRTFLRKAVFLQRSQEVCQQINEILRQSREKLESESESVSDASEKGEGEGEETSEAEGEKEQSPPSPLIPLEDRLFDFLRILAEDVTTQRELDTGLKKLILGAAADKKWYGSEGEMALMGKFCGFVEGRLGVIEGAYAGLELWVGRMEGVERGV